MVGKRSPIAVGSSVGIVAALLFWMAFVTLIFSISDAQGAIGLALSPCFALWFGGSVGAIVFAMKSLDTPNAVVAIAPMIIGVLAIVVLAMFLGSEIYQMTHPTVYPAYRTPI